MLAIACLQQHSVSAACLPRCPSAAAITRSMRQGEGVADSSCRCFSRSHCMRSCLPSGFSDLVLFLCSNPEQHIRYPARKAAQVNLHKAAHSTVPLAPFMLYMDSQHAQQYWTKPQPAMPMNGPHQHVFCKVMLNGRHCSCKCTPLGRDWQWRHFGFAPANHIPHAT